MTATHAPMPLYAGDAPESRLQALQECANALSAQCCLSHATTFISRIAQQLFNARQGTVIAPHSQPRCSATSHQRSVQGRASTPRPTDQSAATRPGFAHRHPIMLMQRTLGELVLEWDAPPLLWPADHQAIAIISGLLAPLLQAGHVDEALRDRLAHLTRRERQVALLLPRGLTNAALASELGIATATVKVHVERILHKLQATDRTQAAVYVVQGGMTA